VEMQQMYRFAELGQQGITLLHDLANSLTALNLEVEDIKRKQHSIDIAHAREIINYLGSIVERTRTRLFGGTEDQTFNIVRRTSEVLTFLGYKAREANVVIDWTAPKGTWSFAGDSASFGQILAITTSNAIDAYGKPGQPTRTGHARSVSVRMEQQKDAIILKISDWGKGIPKNRRKQLFKPYHSAKKSGLGLGLYITKQTVEMQFSGSIMLNPDSDHTEFIIKLPLHHER
jgi:signal transduction histidine kinase